MNKIDFKLLIFYLAYSAFSMFNLDFYSFPVIQIGFAVVYLIDIFYLIVCVIGLLFLFRNGIGGFELVGKIYLLFLTWNFLEIVFNYPYYGFRSLGEARTIGYLYMNFIPLFYFGNKNNEFDDSDVFNFIKLLIYIGGIVSLILFCIELINGGRFFLTKVNMDELEGFSDSRGIRFLDVHHVYCILLLACYKILKIDYDKKYNIFDIIIILISIITAIISQNRTPIIAFLFSMIIIMVIRGKIKAIIKVGLYFISILVIFYITFEEVVQNYLTIFVSSFRLFEPALDDITGSTVWRYAVNVMAFDYALQKFWFGYGYGSYFYFEIPLISNEPIEAPPHNMYIITFYKVGFIGLMILISFLMIYFNKMYKIFIDTKYNKPLNFNMSILFLIAISQIPFGFGYWFVNSFGLFTGISLLFLKRYSKSYNIK